jgi:hypothetical protein
MVRETENPARRGTVKKTIIAMTATAFVATTLLATPASAFAPLIALVILSKKDPNWDAKQSAMNAKAMHVRHHSKKKL